VLQCSSAEFPKQQVATLKPSAKGDKDQPKGETQKLKPTVKAAARPKPTVKAEATPTTSKVAPSRSSSSQAKTVLETEGDDELDETEPVIPPKKTKGAATIRATNPSTTAKAARPHRQALRRHRPATRPAHRPAAHRRRRHRPAMWQHRKYRRRSAKIVAWNPFAAPAG
jgi:hypothetical protein